MEGAGEAGRGHPGLGSELVHVLETSSSNSRGFTRGAGGGFDPSVPAL